jgi:quercetin dioxygenase-like cupin family protein
MRTISTNEQLVIFGHHMKVLTAPEENNNSYAVLEDNVPPLGGPPPHRHPDEELFYVLEGDFEFILNDINNPFKALQGSVVHVPSNALHTFKNVGDKPGKLLTILIPGNLVHFFRAISDYKDLGSLPDVTKVPDLSKVDFGKVFSQAALHQVEFVLPEVAEIKNRLVK